MGFVDLNRFFVPIGKGEEANFSLGSAWGPKYGGWLGWDVLLDYRRVVLLAEAGSGKTSEFRNRTAALSAQGKAAFFVRLEDLADDGFESAIDPQDVDVLDRWFGNGDAGQGWFFLDSVDEARLNNKSIERALRKLARSLGNSAHQRANIYISCRASDWKGRADYQLVERLLPSFTVAESDPTNDQDPDAALLAPVLDSNHLPKTRRTSEKQPPDPDKPLVVQLAPLDNSQARKLAIAEGVDLPDEFILEIRRQGLDSLSDRPVDLLNLVVYWKENGRFASLAAMREYCIVRKLSELDSHRADSGLISEEEARHGAERVAAALTLGKSFTLCAPSQEPDAQLAAGALQPGSVLNDWTPAQRNALLRRGVFSPSTYGRLRFHDRETQEFLAASWLRRLIQEGCPLEAIRQLLFASLYGVDTVVPSLRAPAAWLALDQPEIRAEIIRREPLLLLQFGAPGSLPLGAKEQIVLNYARKHAAGEIADNSLDRRSLSLMAEPGLAAAVREAWKSNSRSEFRLDLLRIICEGKIVECVDLARTIAVDTNEDDALRIVALEALDACQDVEGLAAAAAWLSEPGANAGTRLAASYATTLFPGYLGIESLLSLIGRSPQENQRSMIGFKYVLDQLWDACPNPVTRERFIAGLGDLLLTPPFCHQHHRVSVRHSGLAEYVPSVAHKALLQLGEDPGAFESLLRLLMVVERLERSHGVDRKNPTLHSLVSDRPKLKRALFWKDVEEARKNERHGAKTFTRHWQIYLPDCLWEFHLSDLEWLLEDILKRDLIVDRQVALSASVVVLRDAGAIEIYQSRLSKLVVGQEKLQKDLDAYLSPPVEDPGRQEYERRMARNQKLAEAEKARNKQAWIEFRTRIQMDASILYDPERLSDWAEGQSDLYFLTDWLALRKQTSLIEAPRNWRLLREGFGRVVADAYLKGITFLWRLVPPERPERNGNQTSIKYTSILAFAALDVEAGEDGDWPSQLNQEEIEVAAKYAVLSEQGYPDWLDRLFAHQPDVVLPILKKALQVEWTGQRGDFPVILSFCAQRQDPITPSVQEVLFRLITGRPPGTPKLIERIVPIVRRLDLDDDRRLKLKRFARRRVRVAFRKDEERISYCYLATLFFADADAAAEMLEDWSETLPGAHQVQHVQGALSALFNRSDALAAQTLNFASVDALVRLVRMAYRFVRPEEDRVHSGSFKPNARDRAEEARDAILAALIEKPGPAAYHAVHTLSSDPLLNSRVIRFTELACGKAQIDAEPPAWTPQEVCSFERKYLAPAKTPDSLMNVVLDVLADIRSAPFNADATSRALVQRAESEEELQQWLLEQMNHRAQGRFHAHRETEVAQGDKPDIVISSTAAPFEVALEVKHGGMKWTVKELENALTDQLAKKYLKPQSRRHGVLIISHHRNRRWRSPETRKLIEFPQVVQHLQALAACTLRNANGHYVSLRVVGLDFTHGD